MIDYISTHIGNKYSHAGNIANHFQEIDRCFYANTVEEIIENLEKEGTPFAKDCLRLMKQNSLLSMKITL